MRLPAQPPDRQGLLGAAVAAGRDDRILEALGSEEVGYSQEGRYRHWDTLRRLKPPGDLTHEEWWMAIKIARSQGRRRTPLATPSGTPFTYLRTDEVDRYLHFMDSHLSGEITIDEPIFRDGTRRSRILTNSIIEEATRSSQMEGATTTRVVAKKMIKEGRAPRDRSERMILNNFLAMESIRKDVASNLTPERVTELQRILTEGTLDDESQVGRIQTPADKRVGVFQDPDDVLVHSPPTAEMLPARLQAMCDFANGSEDDSPYVHPAIRAVVLHFWLAYDHPFADGNGRTARALFYWSMIRQGYWIAEYVSISKILRNAPSRYARSFLYTETDEFDGTYFLLNQLDVICRGFGELQRYLERKTNEIRESEQAIARSDRFNGRQLALLKHALRHPEFEYTAGSHARSHRVTFQSARNDLATLKSAHLLTSQLRGRRLIYTPASDLAERLGD